MLRYLIFTLIVVTTVDSHRSLRGEYIRSRTREPISDRLHAVVRTRPTIAVTSADQLSGTVSDLFFPPLPGQSNNDFHPQLRRLPADNETLYYYSWHIHMYFFHENVNVTARALAIRKEFMSFFNIETCLGNCFMGAIFDNCTRMCVWDPVMGVDGPHPYGQWGVYLPNELLMDTLAWMSANHGEFEVLFHPNTGEMVGDHDRDRRAMWIRQTVPLDLDFLRWLQCKWFGCSDRLETLL